MVTCTAAVIPEGVEPAKELLAWHRQTVRCGKPATYTMHFGPRCAECADRFVRTTMLQENVVGIQLGMANKLPASLEEARRLWLRPIN